MKRESISFALAGIFFGFVVGYVLAFQIHAPRTRAGEPQAAATAPGQPAQEDPEAMMTRITEQVDHLKQHIAQDPGDPRPMLDLADLYFQAGKFDQASDYLQMALEAVPDDLQVRNTVGEYLLQLDRVEDARRLFQQSVDQDRDDARSWLDLGVAIFAMEHDEEAAERAFAEVDRIQPGNQQLAEIRRQLALMRGTPATGTP